MHTAVTVLLGALGVFFGTWGALLLAAGAYSAISLHLERRPVRRADARRAIEDAVSDCRRTGLSRWPLVEHAQRLVATRMPAYGFDNGFDFPARAFARGRGYCWQRSGALRLVLEQLGVPAERVFAFRNRFADLPGLVAGHTWLRVDLEGDVRDVCPGRPENAPGRVHFTSLSRVRGWGPGIGAFSYLGCPIANLFAFLVRRVRRRVSRSSP